MIDGALSHASLRLGVVPRLAPVALRPFLQEIETDPAIEAQAKQAAEKTPFGVFGSAS